MQAQIETWKSDKPKVAVIAKQNLLAAPAVDITADIITRMDAGSVKFADLPKVTIKPRPEAAAKTPDDKNAKGKK